MTTPIALITGASGGIGRHIARELAATHVVYVLGRSESALAEVVAAAPPGRAYAIPGDLTSETYRDEVVTSLPRLDVLVHAAANGNATTLETSTIAEWQDQFALQVVAASELTRKLLPLLRDAQGTIVFITSGASVHPVVENYVYAAIKHAVKGMADTIREAEYAHRLRVASIVPGKVDTEMLRRHRGQMGKSYTASDFLTPESVARTVRFVVDAASDAVLTEVVIRPRVPVN